LSCVLKKLIKNCPSKNGRVVLFYPTFTVYLIVTESPLFKVGGDDIFKCANIPPAVSLAVVELKRPASWITVVEDVPAVQGPNVAVIKVVELAVLVALVHVTVPSCLLKPFPPASFVSLMSVVAGVTVALPFPIAIAVNGAVNAPLQLVPVVAAAPLVDPAANRYLLTQSFPLLTTALSPCLYALMLPFMSFTIVVT